MEVFNPNHPLFVFAFVFIGIPSIGLATLMLQPICRFLGVM
jgi:hypothetical protein